ncbi:MAG: DUF4261 domain-containing protein [Ruminococcaceae bacterium]|nr:DUF4261 domain-containing protein [Oscillospiraceae bacterium]
MGLFGKKKKEEHHEPEEQDHVGSFNGFVLLNAEEWDKEKFIADFKENWGIELSETNENGEKLEGAGELLFAQTGAYTVVVGYIGTPIPDGEAEHWAGANFMWKEAVEVVSTHKAQLIVSIFGGDDNLLEKGTLFVKAVCTALKQDHAIAFYDDGIVFSPQQYLDFSEMMEDGSYPILNWIWYGIFADEKRAGIYTYGMRRFGKEEMEVIVDRENVDLNAIRGFLLNITSYVLYEDVTLKDGETIGFSAEQKLKITLGPGLGVHGNTLKIEYGE